ncbi:MAG TPA: mobilome CxxCx(11)CxxC protein [Pyrinomonadaceae bacterium]|nr:mobilome CxxCx(11)CxxC protein [Pyrinomonadaceae bacterium]
MIDEQTADAITQKKLEALCAKHLHIKRLAWLRRWNRAVDFAAIGVPGFYFVFRYLAKGREAGPYVETSWEILAASLVLLVLAKIVFHWEERAKRHSQLLGENIALVRQADNLLATRRTDLSEGVQLFFALVEKTDLADNEAFGIPAEKDSQFAYRQGLKELKGVCQHCKSSPWDYKPGSCQVCGNTPADQRQKKEA